jgi:hypothetical protein
MNGMGVQAHVLSSGVCMVHAAFAKRNIIETGDAFWIVGKEVSAFAAMTMAESISCHDEHDPPMSQWAAIILCDPTLNRPVMSFQGCKCFVTRTAKAGPHLSLCSLIHSLAA